MAETFDRSAPRYRLFEMDDGSNQWWTIDGLNMPLEHLSDEEVGALEVWLSVQPWVFEFFEAFNKHRKATIYGDLT